MFKFRCPFDVPVEVPYVDSDPSMTKQCFKDECDINLIMKNADYSGFVDHVSPSNPLYIDLSDVSDYKESLDFVMSSQEAFQSLPSALRSRFDHDTSKFMEFVSDPANADEVSSFGVKDVSELEAEPLVNPEADLAKARNAAKAAEKV